MSSNIKVTGYRNVKTSGGNIPLTPPMPVNDMLLQASQSRANDALVNTSKGFGTDTDPLTNTFYTPNMMSRRYGELAASFEYWLPRKVVSLIPDDAMAKPWKHVCPSLSPKDLQKLYNLDRGYKVREKFREAWKWERLFGFGMVTMLFDDRMGLYREPISPDMVKKDSMMRLEVFDPQQTFPAQVSLWNVQDPNYRMPINYTLGTAGYMMINQTGLDQDAYRTGYSNDAAIIHHSRCLRLNGLDLPWFSRQNNFYHGQSVIASVNEMISKADLVSQSVAHLLFRLSVPVMKVPRLRDIISDDIASGAFIERMNYLNTAMSNNHMTVIDEKEELANLQQSGLNGVDAIIARYFSLLSVATDIPQTKFMGTSPSGMNATGESDERNYLAACESKRADRIEPAIEDFYNYAFPAWFGIPRPDDHKIVFEPLFRLPKKEEADLQKVEVDTLSQMLMDGAIDTEQYVKEIRRRGIIHMTDEDEKRILEQAKLDDKEMKDALLFDKKKNNAEE